MPECTEKVRLLRHKFPLLDIQVDGGIDLTNINTVAEAGANVIVAGTSIFKSPAPEATIKTMRDAVVKYTAVKTLL